ncbi:unnamed protein product [Notodromas monacha]|uniref:FYVE-type domain-containing protein n=1 Tax=Notodromas monacha TaxID=399045 RepID=A0A7R9BNK2_9CRUS|nr:unnamed protein product [Notodromas monacha]CAG0917939.1 unnamed protein product [Notodromas monacha]
MFRDVLECRNCGVIHRSRKYWHGNPDPDEAVEMEIKHVWPGPSTVLQGTHNAARKVIDGVSYLSETVSTIGSGATSVESTGAVLVQRSVRRAKRLLTVPVRMLQRGESIIVGAVVKAFAQIALVGADLSLNVDGEVTLSACVNHKDMSTPETDVHVRQKIETVSSTLGTLTSLVLDLPIKYLKDTSRPLYWVPDAEITRCFVCQERFDELRTLHHCRSCGQGVCDECSNGRRPVPNRGWDHPVRVDLAYIKGEPGGLAFLRELHESGFTSDCGCESGGTAAVTCLSLEVSASHYTTAEDRAVIYQIFLANVPTSKFRGHAFLWCND